MICYPYDRKLYSNAGYFFFFVVLFWHRDVNPERSGQIENAFTRGYVKIHERNFPERRKWNDFASPFSNGFSRTRTFQTVCLLRADGVVVDFFSVGLVKVFCWCYKMPVDPEHGYKIISIRNFRRSGIRCFENEVADSGNGGGFLDD